MCVETKECFVMMTELEFLIDKWEKQGVELEIAEVGSHIYLAKMIVPEEKRHRGIGTQILKELKQYAGNKEVNCIPSLIYGATSKRRLHNFYKRNNIVILWGIIKCQY